MSLSDLQCKNAKPKTKPYKLSDAHGLYLHILPNGAKYWRLKYRFNNKEKLLSIGVYPEVSLQEARQKQEQARKQLSTGVDPSMLKQQQKQISALSSDDTFEAVALEWHTNNLEKWSARHGESVLLRLKIDIFPFLKGRKISSILPLEFLSLIKKIEDRGAKYIARRTLSISNQVFRYAIVTGRIERNPAADLGVALKPRQHTHYAAIDTDDLPALMQALEKNDACLHLSTRHAVKLMALTFVRTGELINAQWSEINLEECQWNIPAERMKMRSPHIVPLSRQAIEILKAQKELTGNSPNVFPHRTYPTKVMSNGTILKALRLMGYKGKMTGHGFRALAMSTIKEKLGYRHEVVDRQLAHAPRNKVDAAYDRAKFLDERKKMMQKWADYLDKITSQNKILAFKK